MDSSSKGIANQYSSYDSTRWNICYRFILPSPWRPESEMKDKLLNTSSMHSYRYVVNKTSRQQTRFEDKINAYLYGFHRPFQHIVLNKSIVFREYIILFCSCHGNFGVVIGVQSTNKQSRIPCRVDQAYVPDPTYPFRKRGRGIISPAAVHGYWAPSVYIFLDTLLQVQVQAKHVNTKRNDC